MLEPEKREVISSSLLSEMCHRKRREDAMTQGNGDGKTKR